MYHSINYFDRISRDVHDRRHLHRLTVSHVKLASMPGTDNVEAFEVALSLVGVMVFWLGIMKIAEKSFAVTILLLMFVLFVGGGTWLIGLLTRTLFGA